MKAYQIARAIFDDLLDRSLGIDNLDAETQSEMISTWTDIVLNTLHPVEYEIVDDAEFARRLEQIRNGHADAHAAWEQRKETK